MRQQDHKLPCGCACGDGLPVLMDRRLQRRQHRLIRAHLTRQRDVRRWMVNGDALHRPPKRPQCHNNQRSRVLLRQAWEHGGKNGRCELIDLDAKGLIETDGTEVRQPRENRPLTAGTRNHEHLHTGVDACAGPLLVWQQRLRAWPSPPGCDSIANAMAYYAGREKVILCLVHHPQFVHREREANRPATGGSRRYSRGKFSPWHVGKMGAGTRGAEADQSRTDLCPHLRVWSDWLLCLSAWICLSV